MRHNFHKDVHHFVWGGGGGGAMSFRQPFLCFVEKRISDLSYASFLFCMLPFAGQHIFHQFRQTNFVFSHVFNKLFFSDFYGDNLY